MLNLLNNFYFSQVFHTLHNISFGTFYFLFGFFICSSLNTLSKSRVENDSNSGAIGNLMRGNNELNEANEGPIQAQPSVRFYLNIFFLNRKEVLENIVRSKVSRKRRLIRALAKRAAVNLVSDEKLLEKIGQDLIQTIPFKLSLIGVRAEASIVYLQSAYICVEVDLMSVDIEKLIEVNANVETAMKAKSFFDYINIPTIKSLAETYLVKLISGKIMSNLPQTVIEKLQDKLVAEVDIVTLDDIEQGPFLIQTIQYLNSIQNSNKTASAQPTTPSIAATKNAIE